MYQSLADLELTTAQKEHLIEQIIHKDGISLRKVCKMYTLKRRTVRDWKAAIESTGYLHSSKGRPGAIDEVGIKDLISTLGKRKASMESPDSGEMMEIVNDNVQATSSRQGRVTNDVSRNTSKMILHSINATAKQPQTVSKARYAAGSDPRMCYSMWIMAKACSDNVPKQSIWNWDPTGLQVREQGKGSKVYSIKIENDKSPLSTVGDESLDMGIKWVHMGSANGEAIPLILLVAVDDLDPEEFVHFEVPGLTYSSVPGTVGYLCFAKRRTGNTKFITWFLKDIVIASIKRCNTFYKLIGDSFVTCDGEALFLDETFSPSVRDALLKENILLGKIPASCSGILQPSDVAPLFRAAKCKLKNMLKKSQSGDNPVVETSIKDCMRQLEERYSVAIGSEHKTKIAQGCIAIANALQEVLRPQLISRGFTDSGQYPLDFVKLIKKSYTEVTAAVLEIMNQATASDVEFFLQHGQLTEEQMTRSGIPIWDGDRNIPRDNGVLHHQRAVLLTHDATRERRQAYLNNGLPLGATIADCAEPKQTRDQLKRTPS